MSGPNQSEQCQQQASAGTALTLLLVNYMDISGHPGEVPGQQEDLGSSHLPACMDQCQCMKTHTSSPYVIYLMFFLLWTPRPKLDQL